MCTVYRVDNQTLKDPRGCATHWFDTRNGTEVVPLDCKWFDGNVHIMAANSQNSTSSKYIRPDFKAILNSIGLGQVIRLGKVPRQPSPSLRPLYLQARFGTSGLPVYHKCQSKEEQDKQTNRWHILNKQVPRMFPRRLLLRLSVITSNSSNKSIYQDVTCLRGYGPATRFGECGAMPIQLAMIGLLNVHKCAYIIALEYASCWSSLHCPHHPSFMRLMFDGVGSVMLKNPMRT